MSLHHDSSKFHYERTRGAEPRERQIATEPLAVSGFGPQEPLVNRSRRRAELRLALVCIAALVAFTLQSSNAFALQLSLSEAVARAAKNPLARAAIEQWRAAGARVSEARATRLPHAEVTAFIAPSPSIDCLDEGCTRTNPSEVKLRFDGVFGGVRLDVIQPLYTFGKIDSAVDAAQSATNATRALAAGVTGDTTLDTARAYLAVDSAREVLAMLELGRQELEKGKQIIVQRIDEGDAEVTLIDRLRLETLEAEIRVRSSEASEAVANALALLRALVGEPTADTLHASPEPIAFQLADSGTYTRRGRTGRPELRAAREAVAALEAVTRLEQARWFPDVFALAGFDFARATGVDPAPSAFADDPFNATTARLALVMRWNVDPAQGARVSRAGAELSRGRQLALAADRASDAEVLMAYSRAVEARKRLDAARDGEKSARGWVASALQADAVGTLSAKDLGDAYIAYFTLRARVLENIYAWNVAVLTLRRAIGEPVVPPSG
ncbi:MAG TPA: TolC family protein [Polyangiaceae bacterium]